MCYNSVPHMSAHELFSFNLEYFADKIKLFEF